MHVKCIKDKIKWMAHEKISVNVDQNIDWLIEDTPRKDFSYFGLKSFVDWRLILKIFCRNHQFVVNVSLLAMLMALMMICALEEWIPMIMLMIMQNELTLNGLSIQLIWVRQHILLNITINFTDFYSNDVLELSITILTRISAWYSYWYVRYSGKWSCLCREQW